MHSLTDHGRLCLLCSSLTLWEHPDLILLILIDDPDKVLILGLGVHLELDLELGVRSHPILARVNDAGGELVIGDMELEDIILDLTISILIPVQEVNLV